MKVVLYGAPGSGKGTQALMLSQEYKAAKISLGDILREEVKKDSDLGKEVKDYMEKGLLVPDEVVSRVIENNLGQEGFILDGYPRNTSQAKVLDEILRKKSIELDAFLLFDVDEDILVSRMSNRRICKDCGMNYHLISLPSKVDGVCDSCQGPLIQRKDDNPDAIKKRLAIFGEESQKLQDYYCSQKLLTIIEGSGTKEEVFERVQMAFSNMESLNK